MSWFLNESLLKLFKEGVQLRVSTFKSTKFCQGTTSSGCLWMAKGTPVPAVPSPKVSVLQGLSSAVRAERQQGPLTTPNAVRVRTRARIHSGSSGGRWDQGQDKGWRQGDDMRPKFIQGTGLRMKQGKSYNVCPKDPSRRSAMAIEGWGPPRREGLRHPLWHCWARQWFLQAEVKWGSYSCEWGSWPRLAVRPAGVVRSMKISRGEGISQCGSPCNWWANCNFLLFVLW